MLERFKSQWNALKASRAGRRFRDRYERHQRSPSAAKHVWRVVRVLSAAGLVAVGVLFVFIPGPAIVFFFFAGALLATDSLPMAKALDWSEVRLRKSGSRLRRVWRGLSLRARVVVATLGVALSATGTVLFYRFVAN